MNAPGHNRFSCPKRSVLKSVIPLGGGYLPHRDLQMQCSLKWTGFNMLLVRKAPSGPLAGGTTLSGNDLDMPGKWGLCFTEPWSMTNGVNEGGEPTPSRFAKTLLLFPPSASSAGAITSIGLPEARFIRPHPPRLPRPSFLSQFAAAAAAAAAVVALDASASVAGPSRGLQGETGAW